jgi:hypothetical protein
MPDNPKIGVEVDAGQLNQPGESAENNSTPAALVKISPSI